MARLLRAVTRFFKKMYIKLTIVKGNPDMDWPEDHLGI